MVLIRDIRIIEKQGEAKLPKNTNFKLQISNFTNFYISNNQQAVIQFKPDFH